MACPDTQYDSSVWDQGRDSEFSNDRNGKRGELTDFSDACTCTHNSVDLHVKVWLHPFLWVRDEC